MAHVVIRPSKAQPDAYVVEVMTGDPWHEEGTVNHVVTARYANQHDTRERNWAAAVSVADALGQRYLR